MIVQILLMKYAMCGKSQMQVINSSDLLETCISPIDVSTPLRQRECVRYLSVPGKLKNLYMWMWERCGCTNTDAILAEMPDIPNVVNQSAEDHFRMG